MKILSFTHFLVGLRIYTHFAVCLFLCQIKTSFGFCNGNPSGVKVSLKSERKLTISWTPPSVNCGLIGYGVHYHCTKPLSIFSSKNITVLSQRNVDVDVTPSFEYRIFITGLTSSSEISTPGSLSYKVPRTAPDDFPRMQLTARTETSLSLKWGKLNIFSKCGDISGYEILYLTPDKKKIPIHISGEDTTSYTLTGLTPGVTYNFVIKAVNDVGQGPWSLPPVAFSTIPRTTPAILPSSTATTTTSTSTKSTTTTTSTPSTTTTLPTTSTTVTSSTKGTTTKTTKTTNIPTSPTTTMTTTTVFSNTTRSKEAKGDSISLPLILAIVGGCLLLLAIVIPLFFCVCRHCCGKAPVGVEDIKRESRQKPKKDFEEILQDERRTMLPNRPPEGLQVALLVSVVDIQPRGPKSHLTKPNTQYTEMKYGDHNPIRNIPSGQDYPNLLRAVDRSSPTERPIKNDHDVLYNNVKNNHVTHTNNVYIHNFMKPGRMFTPRTPGTPTIPQPTHKSFFETFEESRKRKAPFSKDVVELSTFNDSFKHRNESTPRVLVMESLDAYSDI